MAFGWFFFQLFNASTQKTIAKKKENLKRNSYFWLLKWYVTYRTCCTTFQFNRKISKFFGNFYGTKQMFLATVSNTSKEYILFSIHFSSYLTSFVVVIWIIVSSETALHNPDKLNSALDRKKLMHIFCFVDRVDLLVT